MNIKENVTGLQHLGIPAVDLEKSIKWYTELLGFELIEEKNLPEKNCHAAFVKKGNLVIELYQEDEAAVQEVAARKHGHIDHLALNVQDVKAAFEKMKKADCTMLDTQINSLPFFENGVAWFTVLGPNGEKVEFNQFL